MAEAIVHQEVPIVAAQEIVNEAAVIQEDPDEVAVFPEIEAEAPRLNEE